MKKRVVILNDELGTMALGFSKAGYDIGAIYIDFSDVNNYRVCEKNWGTIIRDISALGSNDDSGRLPTDIDCIAGRIHASFSIAGKKATRGSLRELGKLIICLSDEDVNKLIDMKINKEDPADYLEALLDDMLMDLEK